MCKPLLRRHSKKQESKESQTSFVVDIIILTAVTDCSMVNIGVRVTPPLGTPTLTVLQSAVKAIN